jgi:hypothetical protein
MAELEPGHSYSIETLFGVSIEPLDWRNRGEPMSIGPTLLPREQKKRI